MNIKLLLISLRDPFLDSDRVMPPIGVMALHSYIISLGFESAVEIDFDINHIERYENYTHFAISCMTPQKKEAYGILHKIKEKYPEKIVIIGGPHAGYYLEDCLKEPFDYIVVGDGEYALKYILEGKADKKVLNTNLTESEMNNMPLPYREKEFLQQYNFDIQGLSASTILTAKGCPMSCAFCEDANTNVRLYNPKYVSMQIKDVLRAGFNSVMFFDDIFALSKKRVKQLSEEISKHDIYYRCFAHSKTMDDEMAKLLSGSGCIEIGFGAESGSQKILDAINKKTTVEKNMKLIECCNKYGIRVKAFLILGLPGENLESIKETKNFLDFILGNKFTNRFGKTITNDFDITIYFPYKGTKIRDSIDKNLNEFDLFFTTNPDNLIGYYKGKKGDAEVSARTSFLSGEDIKKIQIELLSEYKKRRL